MVVPTMDAPNRFAVSPLVLAEIITVLGDRPDPRVGRTVRFPLRGCRARAYPSNPEGNPFPIDVVDLGFSGIGFRTHAALETGDAFVIEFNHLGIPPQRWPCVVVRATPEEGGAYRVGARFESAQE